jgi:hypothetical protein
MIRYYLSILALFAIALVFPMESYADSFRFVIVQADGQVIAIPGKDFLYMVVTWLGYAGAVFAFGFFLRILRYRVF